jgi:hypothetical protein
MVEAEKDPNYIAYQSLLKQDDWYNRHKGQYVIFVDGKLVDYDHDKKTLLERVNEIYKEKPKFYEKVDRTRPRAIDIPTPFLD